MNSTVHIHRYRAVKTMVAESPLTSVSLMQDGATIAAGSIRGKIYIYDLRTGATPMRVISAHKSSVKCLAFEEARNKPRVWEIIHRLEERSSVNLAIYYCFPSL